MKTGKLKIVIALVFIAFFSLTSFAQSDPVDINFEKNKSKYKLEKFSEGEDASSGFDYLIYKKGNEIVKIREIWSSSAVRTYRIEDYFFKDGKIINFAGYTFAGKFYKTALRGAKIPLREVERLRLSDLKLTDWLDGGKKITAEDDRWKEKEREITEKAAGVLETYQRLREEN